VPLAHAVVVLIPQQVLATKEIPEIRLSHALDLAKVARTRKSPVTCHGRETVANVRVTVLRLRPRTLILDYIERNHLVGSWSFQ